MPRGAVTAHYRLQGSMENIGLVYLPKLLLLTESKYEVVLSLMELIGLVRVRFSRTNAPPSA